MDVDLFVAVRGFAGAIVAEDAPIATEGLDATGSVGLDDAHREMLPQGAGDFDLDGVRLADVADRQEVGLPGEILGGRRGGKFHEAVADGRNERLDVAQRPRGGEAGKLFNLRPLGDALPPRRARGVDRRDGFPVVG